MDDRYILAIDQGTTNTKALLVNAMGEIVAKASRPLSVRYPEPGWVEQDAEDIWQSVEEAIAEVMSHCSPRQLMALAISNQRESVVIWERTSGKPVGPCVIWQCRRSSHFCSELRAYGLEQEVRQRTGLTIDPMFSAGKARWLLAHIPDGFHRAAQGELCLGTVDAWLLWNLTRGRVHACDVTNASRTQLMNIRTLAWDGRMLDLYGIPAAILPQIRPSSFIYGETGAIGHVPAGIPIASMIGDSHAALFAHAGFQPGSIKATYGTGTSLMTPTPQPLISQYGLSTTIAWMRDKPTYALEGNILATGAAVQWLSDVLSLADPAQIEALAAQVADNGGVYLVPAFVGLGAPHWSESARGLIAGLTRGTSAAHLARATLEAIAFQVRDVFDAMQTEAAIPLTMLFADGGASRNNLLMQLQADIIGRPVRRSTLAELSALGAAYLAGLAVGLWADEEDIAKVIVARDCFEPRLSASERARMYAGWQDALARTLYRLSGQLVGGRNKGAS